ncbi:MAG: ZIP family metal transporter [Candidatus Marinimicrobia bacterium]|nr:ZIP family metal transporter [Candidatus Neomarinimicrobiota bacterium]
MTTWIYTFTSIFIISLLSLTGAFTLSLSRDKLSKILQYLVSFAVGSLFGGAFVHLLPEIFTSTDSIAFSSIHILVGIILFFVLEKFVRWRHCHDVDCQEHSAHLVPMNLIGDAMHNLIDGLIIGASFLVSIPMGIATSIAVAMHELPQEIGDFGVLIHGGLTVKRALMFNFLISLTSFLGAAISLVIGEYTHGFINALLPITAGGFIYIAGSDLIPELHHHTHLRKSAGQLTFIVLGVIIMYVLKMLT